MPHTWWLN